ncbi:MAG: hypothetical protein NTV94_11080, partial [Planctomycetota bacterium]|nr:hypothetical protein [Planctomycetota bacterium]
SIVDGNMTNLIVCVVLYYMGTPEIRGFAITMGIGVIARSSRRWSSAACSLTWALPSGGARLRCFRWRSPACRPRSLPT